MRYLTLFLLAFSFLQLTFAQWTPTPGDILRYEAVQSGNTYSLIVKIRKTGVETELDFEMSEPGNKSGKILLFPEALEYADKLQTFLATGNIAMRDKTCFLLSKKMLKNCSTPDGAVLYLDNEPQAQVMKTSAEKSVKIYVRGRETDVKAVELTNGMPAFKARTLLVLNNPDFPLLLRFGTGMVFTLKEVR
jgi:hypothetical protein